MAVFMVVVPLAMLGAVSTEHDFEQSQLSAASCRRPVLWLLRLHQTEQSRPGQDPVYSELAFTEYRN